MNSILEEALNKLVFFRKELNSDNLDEFNEFKEKIMQNLDEGLKVRFQILKFYEISDDNNFDIPF